MKPVTLEAKLGTFSEHWPPRADVQVNGHALVVPGGVEHRPVTKEEWHILLIEPAGTPNTGDPVSAAARPVI